MQPHSLITLPWNQKTHQASKEKSCGQRQRERHQIQFSNERNIAFSDKSFILYFEKKNWQVGVALSKSSLSRKSTTDTNRSMYIKKDSVKTKCFHRKNVIFGQISTVFFREIGEKGGLQLSSSATSTQLYQHHKQIILRTLPWKSLHTIPERKRTCVKIQNGSMCFQFGSKNYAQVITYFIFFWNFGYHQQNKTHTPVTFSWREELRVLRVLLGQAQSASATQMTWSVSTSQLSSRLPSLSVIWLISVAVNLFPPSRISLN